MYRVGKFLKILFMCHSKPERSFYFKGKKFPICARCTGILLGWIVGIIYCLLLEVPKEYITILILFPLIVDGTMQSLRKKESNNIKRIITGILFGMGTIFIFVYFHRTMVKLALIFLEKCNFIK